MIYHVVMWRLSDEAKGHRLISLNEQLQCAVEEMRRNVPGTHRLELRVNRQKGLDTADLLLSGQFDSWDSLKGYEEHRLHKAFREMLKPLRVERRVVDYEV
jgi:Stress responsive A/B Barrel Domain